MPAQSEEYKFALQIEKYTERIGMDYAFTVMRCITRNTAVQQNMFELVTSFLNSWAHMYDSGLVKPEHKAYAMCEMSYRMLEAMRSGNETEPIRTGRHRCGDDE